MAKIKKEVVESNGAADVTIKEEDTYAEKVKNVNQIASPLASKKLTKKCYKLIKKGKSRRSAGIWYKCGRSSAQNKHPADELWGYVLLCIENIVLV